MFAYFIVADIWIPLTPDSTVMRVVTPISRVSGYVPQVYVHNNSTVKKGDLLYELDPTPFRYQGRRRNAGAGTGQTEQPAARCANCRCRSEPETAQLTARNDRVTYDRYQRLSSMQNVSQADLDKVRTTWQTSEQSVTALHATIHNLQIQRGERTDNRNVTLKVSNHASGSAVESGLDEDPRRSGWYRQQPAAEPEVVRRGRQRGDGCRESKHRYCR